MGGRALKNTSTRRYLATEYFDLIPQIFKCLNSITKIDRMDVIPAYRTKESFGDMDVVYSTWDDLPLCVEDIKSCFNVNEIVRNGSVISFDFKELQIDVIHLHQESYDYGISYFSWNDCGNIVGKCAHRLGLKHGHNGLFLPLRYDDNVFAEICVTTNHHETLRFLGLDPIVFTEGFDTLEQMFEFVIKSPYYHPDQYLLENLNTVAKIRDRKRDTYRKFLEYGKTIDTTKLTSYEHRSDKSDFMPLIFKTFPDSKIRFDHEMKCVSLRTLAKTKFNGDIVSELTELKERQLGMFMSHLKSVDVLNDPHQIVYLSVEHIKKLIMKAFESYTASQLTK